MVLPTLHSQYATKHLATPQQIMQRKHEIEAEKKAQWAQTANYFKAQTRHNSVHSHWTSPTSAVISHEANRAQQEKEEKLNQLEQRRNRLAAILEAEKLKFQNELASVRQSSRESIPDMKMRAESLRSARERERQVIADEKLYEHWVTNDPDLRSVEQQKLQNLQPEYWSEQLQERRLAQEEEEEMNFKYQEELRLRLDEQEKLEHEEQYERKKRIEELKMILQQQMDELKEKEEESEILKQEEERLLREQWEFDQFDEQKKQMEKRYVQQDYGRQLLRQHKAKLHKRAKEIQEQLELDMKILASIAQADQESQMEQSEQREQLRRDALHMLKQFQQQMKLEKEKEQELDAMFQEEAAKEWARREQEWDREKELREKLMRQVMDERQEQVMEKLHALKEQQQETYERQRALISDMEQARKYDLIEKQKQIKEREEKKQDFQRQVKYYASTETRFHSDIDSSPQKCEALEIFCPIARCLHDMSNRKK
ncbi:unnamed protein product [Rotaria socialis]|uniref:Trichoplein keratin filament-binding protein n=1 Tax=Rotaria socialis TaxID=392032 RepID=A0A819A4I5_9BILA|nr:unnamed protein product [Rotaria socialis]CAF3778758.1 unnamed protein product [Rotaria socialis]CAF4340626.1 unnamed protein product [Rotaria socialis]CAF4463376.1 unnamed protein product [Rotaria socialis]CAF4693284.1 unnamed protein product [Rotaria socialis]